MGLSIAYQCYECKRILSPERKTCEHCGHTTFFDVWKLWSKREIKQWLSSNVIYECTCPECWERIERNKKIIKELSEYGISAA